MRLTDLLKGIAPIRVSGPADPEIRSLQYDSRKVEPGDVFFAWKGIASDGHRFIPEVLTKGATVIVLENEYFISSRSITFVLVKNVREALSYMAAAFFKHPDRMLSLLGVTGTNGKTTTTFILKHALGKSFGPVGLIGTVRYEIGDEVLPSSRTTPESLDLMQHLSQMREAKCRSAVMEVSSHALALNRVDPLQFRVGIFTNLTQDHLDFHHNLEDYRDAKWKLFERLTNSDSTPPIKGTAVINIDDQTGRYYLSKLAPEVPRLTYSAAGDPDADVSAIHLEYAADGTRGELCLSARSVSKTVDQTVPFESPLLGSFNVANLLAAFASALAMGIPVQEILSLLPTIPQVPGRLECFRSADNVTAVVDYAHTDDAVTKALAVLRQVAKERLIVVIGCGGNRDSGKRPLMARAAVEGADLAIFTADNPRNENIEKILDDMVRGVSDSKYKKKWERIPERRQAIAHALALAKSGDIVCIAGKGHETTQEIAGRYHPFDDRIVVQEFLKMRIA